MSPAWLAFLCGGLMGGFAGICIVSLCMVAKQSDVNMPSPRLCDHDQGRTCHECADNLNKLGGMYED